MDGRQSFLQDDDDDSLLFEKLQEHVLERYPNPERKGCIDHTTLETWVYSPRKLDLSDPKYLHVLKCAECTRELIELRKQRDARRKAQLGNQAVRARNWRWAGLAAVLVCSIALGGVAYWRSHFPTSSTAALPATPVALTIDLSQAGTTRGGETSAVPPVALPRRVVAAHILLPYFSPGGKYVVSVTTDRNGTSEKAIGRAVANVQGIHTDLTVALDLRSLPSGTYFLSTTHEGDPASYFYPLTVK
ncbi:MAG: hypothetical protein JST28_19285 [Acidobacteria bacterium]|nr:hypothetical protein [Acidobacteriota bacterium]